MMDVYDPSMDEEPEGWDALTRRKLIGLGVVWALLVGMAFYFVWEWVR